MHIDLCYITFNTWVLVLKYFPPLPIPIVLQSFLRGTGSHCISVVCAGTCCTDQVSSSSGSAASAATPSSVLRSWWMVWRRSVGVRAHPCLCDSSYTERVVCWFGGGCPCCTCGDQRTACRSWLSAHQVSPRDLTQVSRWCQARCQAPLPAEIVSCPVPAYPQFIMVTLSSQVNFFHGAIASY